MRATYIQGLAGVLPGAPVGNEQMEAILGQIGTQRSRERALILRRNGIRQRYYVLDPETGQPRWTNAQLTAQAVTKLTADTGLQQLDLLACGTSTPDQIVPGHAAMVHGELGGGPCEAVSFGGVCCSSMAALRFAHLAIASGAAEQAVATGSEVCSTFMRAGQFRNAPPEEATEDRPELAFDGVFLRWMLSDGAGAMLLGPRPASEGLSLRIEWIDMRSYAHEQATCMSAGGLKQADGSLKGWREFDSPRRAAEMGVFNFRQDVRQLNENIDRVMIKQGLVDTLTRHPLQAAEVDWFLPHLSSMFFSQRCEQALRDIGFAIPGEKIYTNLSEVGNVGSASPFLMIEALMSSKRARAGDKILCFIPESGRFSVAYMLLTVVAAGSA